MALRQKHAMIGMLNCMFQQALGEHSRHNGKIRIISFAVVPNRPYIQFLGVGQGMEQS
jgi:hypothetical protein